MDSFLSFPALFLDSRTKKINCCWTVWPNRKWTPKNFGPKMKLQTAALKTKVKCNLANIVWKDKRNVNILANMHSPPGTSISVMSIERLWNRPWYKTKIDICGMWANLTACQTLARVEDGLGNGQITILPFPGPCHSQQFYHYHLLWFKIITLTVQTDRSEEPNTRGGKDTVTSDRKARQTSPYMSLLKVLI
jgi:hypothetical protein